MHRRCKRAGVQARPLPHLNRPVLSHGCRCSSDESLFVSGGIQFPCGRYRGPTSALRYADCGSIRSVVAICPSSRPSSASTIYDAIAVYPMYVRAPVISDDNRRRVFTTMATATATIRGKNRCENELRVSVLSRAIPI